MANVNRGEVALKVGDSDYVLKYSANALCDPEAVLKMPIVEITDLMSDPKKISMTTVRAMLWAGLKSHHPKITLDQAGDMIEKLTLSGALVNVGLAFQAAFPEADENPQELDGQQLGGTGPASSQVG